MAGTDRDIRFNQLNEAGDAQVAWTDIVILCRGLGIFAVVENTGAKGLKWQALARAIDGGNQSIVYGPVLVTNGNKDSAFIAAGPSEVVFQIQREKPGDATTYKLEVGGSATQCG